MPKTIYFSQLALVGGAVAALLGADLARAQAPSGGAVSSSEQKAFNISAQPLSQAALRFSDQAGVQLVFGAPVADGLRANAVQGRYTVVDALNRLLAGSGLTWRYLNARTITIERQVGPAPSGVRTFGVVRVEGEQVIGDNGFADLGGFGAGAGGNGSSDVTATEGSGSLTTNGTSVASGVPQSLKDATGSTVSVVTHEQIEQQDLTDLTSALAYVPGITLLPSGQGSTTLISRGFNVGTIQVDGGAPLAYSPDHQISPQKSPDLSEYDHVEVLRGSDALLGGNGNPGGVINLERKRPLDHDQLTVDGETGSWNNERVEVDATGPVGFDGHLRGRVDVTYQDRDFFYDVAHQTKTHIYGVLEADVGPDTLVRIGGSYGTESNPGINVYGLPRYSNGDDLHLSRSTCLCAPWNKDDSKSPEVFAALEHRFNDDWRLKLDATETNQFDHQHADFLSGAVASGGTTTLAGGPEDDDFVLRQYIASATLNGAFQMFGLKQQVVAGFQYSKTSLTTNIVETEGGLGTPIDIFNPNFGPDPGAANPNAPFTDPTASFAVGIGEVTSAIQGAGFVNFVLQPLKGLHVSGGVRYGDNRSVVDTSTSGAVLGPDVLTIHQGTHDYNQVTPSVTVAYDLTHTLSAYGSYAKVVTPQGTLLAPDLTPIPDSVGTTYQAGFKANPRQGKINASLDFYYTEQTHQALMLVSTLTEPNGCCYEDAGALKSAGFDLNVTGELAPGWQISGGYTYDNTHYSHAFFQELNDTTGSSETTLTQQPHHQVKFYTSYVPQGRFKRWTVGGALRLESDRFTKGSACSLFFDATGTCAGGVIVPFAFTQPLYAVADLHIGYRLGRRWQASLNLTNITDTRYYATAGAPYAGNFYGEPRAFLFSLKAKY